MAPKGILDIIWIRGLSILFAFAVLYFLFSAPSQDLASELKQYSESNKPDTVRAINKDAESPENVFMLAEYQKVVDEIEMRIEQENDWFRYKFLFVGSLFLAFLTHLAIKMGQKDSIDNLDDYLNKLLKSNAALTILALAFVVSMVIDIHIRIGVTVINQGGLWIAHYAEPFFLNTTFIPGDDALIGKFLPWEQYLRIPGAMHMDKLSALTFWPHVHFLTFLMYLVYIVGFQRLCIKCPKRQVWVIAGAYILVHLSITAFALMAHAAPDKFTFSLNPFFCSISGFAQPLIYFGISVLLLLIHLPYLWSLISRSLQGEGSDPE